MNILEISLLTDNLQKTERFYTGTMGLRVARRAPGSISFQAGKSLLTFNRSYRQKPVYHFAFNIPANKLSEAITWASLKVSLLDIENNSVVADFHNWNARAFYFNDNNGNILELIARADLKNPSEQPFDSSGILAISEIGLVTDNVPLFAKDLNNNYRLPLFSKQPIRENFAALGDDNGLLILSLTGRHWYPTNQQAKKFYTHLKLLVDEEIIEITVNN